LKKVTYKGNEYVLTDETPKTGDLVLTDDYGVWEFHTGTASIPYWCNPNTCKKILSIDEVEVNLSNKDKLVQLQYTEKTI
jgi:hypothetical protein